MTTISKDAKLITFINVFTVEPADQQWVVDLLVPRSRWRSLRFRCVPDAEDHSRVGSR
jgi:hypothetical protein